MEDLYYNSGNCDTTDITFSKNIMPLMENYCIECHKGNTPDGDIPIENYNDVVKIASDGSLLGTIRFEQGYYPMPPPPDYNKMTDCEILQIEIWIKNGMPNN
jgi:hypothetical protein